MGREGDNRPGRVFICYRREESAYPAGWLYDRLAERYGSRQIFKDVDSIKLGDDFVEVIRRAVASCDVLLVLIGKDWLTPVGPGGRRRIDEPDDFVRLELEAAMSRRVRVIPILINGATMPDPEQLPRSVAALGRRQALELSPSRFDSDTDRLLTVLDETIREVHTAQLDAVPRHPSPPRSTAGAVAQAGTGYVPGTRPGSTGQIAGQRIVPALRQAGSPISSHRSGRPVVVVLSLITLLLVGGGLILGISLVLNQAHDSAGRTTGPSVFAPSGGVGGETSVTVSPDGGISGTKITVRGEGFSAHETVEIRFHTDQITTTKTDDRGGFTARTAIPSDFDMFAPRTFEIVVTGRTSIKTATAPFHLR